MTELHHLLKRQLKRLSLSENNLPNAEQWLKFLLNITQAYQDFEQDRYLLERSLFISSNELADLNNNLELAQEIAHLGSWHYDRKLKKVTWSKQTFRLFNLDMMDGEPSFDDIIAMVHEEDKPEIVMRIEQAFSEGKDFEMELRMNVFNKGFRWHYTKGHPHAISEDDNEQSIRYLSGIVMDITERKDIENTMKELETQLVDKARQAGMADVAIAILHNVGNILNSAKVSVASIKENMKNSCVEKLKKISDLIKEHIDKKDDYLTTDEKGKLISPYLAELTKVINEKYQSSLKELDSIEIHLQHIEDIVATQKDFHGTTGIIEKIFLPDIIDRSIQLSFGMKIDKELELIKKYNDQLFLITDKTKLLQILVNLIRNAKEAIKLSDNLDKKIIIACNKVTNSDNVQISVTDTGNGILEKDIPLLFTMGFTTKKNGHGFGLHSSALAAKEMGGFISVNSAGKNKGSTFTLELPLTFDNKQKGEKHYVSL